MVNAAPVANAMRISVRSVERDRSPQAIQSGIQSLHASLATLNRIEQITFLAVTQSPRHRAGGSASGELPAALPHLNQFIVGLYADIQPENFRSIMHCLGDWLDRTVQHSRFEITLPPAHSLVLQTDQAKALAQLLPLVERLLPPEAVYLSQAQRYVETYGELTPTAKASLTLLQQRLGLPTDVANDLNARAMGPFKTLAEKCQHFRKELLVCKQESDLDTDFWRVMQDKAAAMSLPPADADFLRDERLQTLRAEAERARAEAEAAAQAERDRQQQTQQRLASYRRAFEAIAVDALGPDALGLDRATFQQRLRTQLSGSDLNRGRLAEAQAFFQLGPQEVAAAEQPVLDELHLLSGVL